MTYYDHAVMMAHRLGPWAKKCLVTDGTQTPRYACVLLAEDRSDVVLRFSEWRHITVFLNRRRTGVIGRQGKSPCPEARILLRKISRATFKVFAWVVRIDPEIARGVRHKLGKTARTFRRHSLDVPPRFLIHQSQEQVLRHIVSARRTARFFQKRTTICPGIARNTCGFIRS
jgi:hypothetical protein